MEFDIFKLTNSVISKSDNLFSDTNSVISITLNMQHFLYKTEIHQ